MNLPIQSAVSLKPFNSFAIDVRADRLVEARSDEQIAEALHQAQANQWPVLVMGGGSNLLLTGDVQGLVLRVATRGIRQLADDGDQVIIEAQAGEPWHDFVLHTLALGMAGLENLSLIPGTVGAAPIQNIGAYGVEIKDVFQGLTALDRQTGATHDFSLQECQFGYRDSIFKRNPGRWLILRVRFVLHRVARLHLDYGPVRQRLTELGIEQATASDVSSAICSIRREKLPDPAQLGNAGSFFKNPLVSAAKAQRLQLDYPALVTYPQAGGDVKLAAGWLIEHAGWKGFREGDAGVHQLQSLVLVNYGQASGAQIYHLAQRIQADIHRRFGVELELEPNLY